jgi:hypothetical protein
MLDYYAIHTIIDTAMQSQQSVHIRYKDFQGNISEREISPREWVDQGKILAFCHLRNDERNFLVRNIIDIRQQGFAQNPVSEQPSSVSQTVTTVINPKPVARSARASGAALTAHSTFTRVTSAEEWAALLGYYRESLIHEYQQQFSLSKRALWVLDIEDEIAFTFLAGGHQLEIKLNSPQHREFFDSSRRRNQQLCMGKSFVCLTSEKISPLLFVSITVDQEFASSKVMLKPEEYSVSYAALMSLGFTLEEVAEFLQEYQEFVQDQPSMQAIETFIVKSISERLSRPLPVFTHADYSLANIPDYSIFNGSGLFWADSEFTGSLIAELATLSKSEHWSDAPSMIRGCFDEIPEHEHAEAPDFIDDHRFYVTDINTQQRKAARAVSEHPVTIVKGPPGTGKSQLVLNLIAQAYLDGKTVLFASHNNKAVDVVMDRLQGEIRFPGAIRTGSKPNRKRAVEQMASALAQVHEPSLQDFQARYQEGKKRLKATNEWLDLIRDLKGKIHSYALEKEEILEKLGADKREEFSSLQLPFIEADKIRINEFLSLLADELRGISDQRDLFVVGLTELLTDRDKKQPAIQMIREYEQQWGKLAGGLLNGADIPSLHKLISYSLDVKRLLEVLSLKKKLVEAKREYTNTNNRINQKTEAMSEEDVNTTLSIAEGHPDERLKLERKYLAGLDRDLKRMETNDYGLLEKFAIFLGLSNPKQTFGEKLKKLTASIPIKIVKVSSSASAVEAFRHTLGRLVAIIETAFLLHKLERQKNLLSDAETNFKTGSIGVSTETVSEFDRLDLSSYEAGSLIDMISGIEQKANQALSSLKESLDRASGFLIKNNEDLATLQSFRQLAATTSSWDAFGFNTGFAEQDALAWVQMWQKIIVLWEANAVISYGEQQLSALPGEEEALDTYQQANKSLFALAGELMQATWYSRAANTSNTTFEGTKKYVSAVKQLNELEYGKDVNRWRILKEAEQSNFAYALQLFPVWAVTNLTAKTNFPLQAELFDLVIIDEASQCDIPSAIPLLYRAKKVAVIGDPNQLRHVATLEESLDKQTGRKFGIGLEAFSYTSLSLYDLGERKVGLHPGPVLLDEHYRSDPRIITFSNEEFYGGQLKIKTDLSRRGFQKDFLNQRGGAYWIKVKGDFKRPPNGSAYNPEELRVIQQSVARILQALDREGYPNATVGVVTPFRAQENQIRDWLNRSYSGNKRIRSGTAHQFQGDECDVILFSPVLTAGIPEGSLRWLEQTYNLLNVAITRARVSLIVIGDFDFCYNDLPSQSRYNRLARYINDRLQGVHATVDEILAPEVEQFEILGTLLDPSNPEFNHTNLVRFIATCQDFVYWTDPYFEQGIIDLFDELYRRDPRPTIKEFRLLTSERQVKPYMEKAPALRPKAVIRMKEYFKKIGVDFDMRILPHEDIPHDRFLYHPGGAINMPPFAAAYGKHRRVSEYAPSKTTVNNFISYWDKGIPVENYQ